MKKLIIIILLITFCVGQIFSEDLNAMFKRAMELGNEGKNEEAIEVYTQMIKKVPKAAQLYGNRAILLSRLGRYEDALRDCVDGLKIEPKNADLLNSAGVNCVSIGAYQAGKEYYEEAIASDPKFHYAWNNLGFVLYLDGEYDESVKALDKAIELDPKYGNAYLNRGLAYIALNDYDTALSDIDHALAENDDAKLMIIKLYCLHNCDKKAFRKYKKELKKHNCADESQQAMLEFISRKWWQTGKSAMKKIERENEDKPKHEYDEMMCEDYFYYGLRYYFWKMKRQLKRYMSKCVECDIPYFAEYYLAKQIVEGE